MQLNVKTILNLKEKNPRFVYRDVRLTETKGQRIEVKVEPRRGSKGISVLAAAKNVLAMTVCLSESLSMFPSGELPLFSSTVCAVWLAPPVG